MTFCVKSSKKTSCPPPPSRNTYSKQMKFIVWDVEMKDSMTGSLLLRSWEKHLRIEKSVEEFEEAWRHEDLSPIRSTSSRAGGYCGWSPIPGGEPRGMMRPRGSLSLYGLLMCMTGGDSREPISLPGPIGCCPLP